MSVSFPKTLAAGLVGRSILVIGAYLLAAKAGVALSHSEKHLALLWPPAGLAVAAILLGGSRYSPAVGLGAFLAAAWSQEVMSRGWATSAFVCASIAFFSTAQALLIARMLRNTNLANVQTSLAQVGRMLLAVVFGCAVAAVGNAATIAIAGSVPWRGHDLRWLSWWLSQSVGVFVVAPPLLAICARHRKERALRGPLQALSLGVGLALVIFIVIRDLGERQRMTRFEGEAKDAVAAVQSALDNSKRELDAIASLYKIVPTSNYEQFVTFVEPFLRQSLVIQAFEWVPRVRHEDRAAYEREGRTLSPSFGFVEHDLRGRLVPASDRTEYFPVLFVEPLNGNEHDLGLDIASDPTFAEALQRMRRTERAVATAPIYFDAQDTTQVGILIFSPVAVRTELRGFALGAFRAGDLIEGALVASRPREVALQVADVAGSKETVLFVSPTYSARGDHHYQTTINVAGRSWTIRCSPTTSEDLREKIGAWLGLLASLGFTLMIAAYLSQRARAEIRLRQGHDQLAIANEHLATKSTQLEATIRELMLTRAKLVQEEKLKSVGRLAAGIAHEINTPIQFVNDSIFFVRDALADLTTLIGCYQAALRSLDNGERSPRAVVTEIASAEAEADLPYLRENLPQAVERSLDGLERVATIVRSMKEFAHPDQQDMISVDLNHAIESTLTIARNEYKFVADIAKDFAPLPSVTCYAGELNQAVLNIIVNAAHSIGDVVNGTTNRGTITVRTRHEGDSVVISVSDTGTGIRRDLWDHIYDPFFTTKEVGKGTGQGLAITRAVVDKHGGDLHFETEEGVGTTFFIRLPILGRKAEE
jgi:signal transduction histidine kinase